MTRIGIAIGSTFILALILVVLFAQVNAGLRVNSSFTSVDAPLTANEYPRLNRFYFTGDANVGRSVRARCGVKRGRGPFSFHFLKDGKDLEEASNVKITTRKYSAKITIKPLRKENSGNYTCMAIHVQTQMAVLKTTELIVRDNDTYIEGSIGNVTATAGNNATLECIVRNLKQNVVSWIRMRGLRVITTLNSTWINNPRYSITNDSDVWSLHIYNVTYDDEGDYMCQVNTDPIIYGIGYLRISEPEDEPESESEYSYENIILISVGVVLLVLILGGSIYASIHFQLSRRRNQYIDNFVNEGKIHGEDKVMIIMEKPMKKLEAIKVEDRSKCDLSKAMPAKINWYKLPSDSKKSKQSNR